MSCTLNLQKHWYGPLKNCLVAFVPSMYRVLTAANAWLKAQLSLINTQGHKGWLKI